MLVKESLVNFKGINGNIYINIKRGEFQQIIEELDKKLGETIEFFKGANILGIKGEELPEEEIEKIADFIKSKYQLNLLEILEAEDKRDKKTFSGIHEGMTKFINATVRSGQVIEYGGNIVIIGDVNPGALIKARGNIVVLGSLKGVAHAGIDGNNDAIVAAYDLQPMQLRIGSVISRKPDENVVISEMPEIARVSNGEVIIEPYLPRK